MLFYTAFFYTVPKDILIRRHWVSASLDAKNRNTSLPGFENPCTQLLRIAYLLWRISISLRNFVEALRHSFGELKLPSSQTLLTRNVPLAKGTICLSLGKPVCSPLYSTAVFNLYVFVVYFIYSLSLCSFWAQKERKTPGTRVEQVVQGSCSWVTM